MQVRRRPRWPESGGPERDSAKQAFGRRRRAGELQAFTERRLSNQKDWLWYACKEQLIRYRTIPLEFEDLRKEVFSMLASFSSGGELPPILLGSAPTPAPLSAWGKAGFEVTFGKPLKMQGMARYFYGVFESVSVVVFWGNLPELMAVAFNRGGARALAWRNAEVATHFDALGWNLEDVLAILGAPTVADHLKRYGYEVKGSGPAKEFASSYLETVFVVSGNVRKFVARRFRWATKKKPLPRFSLDAHIYCLGKGQPKPYSVIHVMASGESVWVKVEGVREMRERLKLLEEIFIEKYGQVREAVLTAFKELVVAHFTRQVALKMM